MAETIFTIVYEQASLDQVIGALRGAGVAVVLDVRAASRRAGFSKTLLGGSLNAARINYVHLRALGMRKAGREAARAGRAREMRAIFEAHMTERLHEALGSNIVDITIPAD